MVHTNGLHLLSKYKIINSKSSYYSEMHYKYLVEHFVRAIPNNIIVRQCLILVGKCPMSDHYFKHCKVLSSCCDVYNALHYQYNNKI